MTIVGGGGGLNNCRSLGLGPLKLGWGSIYPDTIESGGTKRADVIKTHHNRVPIIQQMIDEGHAGAGPPNLTFFWLLIIICLFFIDLFPFFVSQPANATLDRRIRLGVVGKVNFLSFFCR